MRFLQSAHARTFGRTPPVSSYSLISIPVISQSLSITSDFSAASRREKRKIVSEREKCSEIKPEWQRESVRYGERNTERKIDIDREAARKRRSEKNKEIEI